MAEGCSGYVGGGGTVVPPAADLRYYRREMGAPHTAHA